MRFLLGTKRDAALKVGSSVMVLVVGRRGRRSLEITAIPESSSFGVAGPTFARDPEASAKISSFGAAGPTVARDPEAPTSSILSGPAPCLLLQFRHTRKLCAKRKISSLPTGVLLTRPLASRIPRKRSSNNKNTKNNNSNRNDKNDKHNNRNKDKNDKRDNRNKRNSYDDNTAYGRSHGSRDSTEILVCLLRSSSASHQQRRPSDSAPLARHCC